MRISHSALTTYLECPYKYFLHYFRKLRPTAEKSSLAFGNAVDIGLNHLLETRDVDGAIQKFQAAWTSLRDKKIAIDYSKSDLDDFLVEDDPGNTWLCLYRKGRILIEEFHAQIMPRIKDVIAVQVNRTVNNEFGDELIIKTDFICVWEDGRRILFDNKTSSVKYEDDSVKTSPQLGIYFEQLKAEYDLDQAGYIVIPKRINKKKLPRVEIKVIIDNVAQETLNETLSQYDEVLNQLKAAEFPRNTKSCIGKYGKCPYYNYCHKGSKEGLKE